MLISHTTHQCWGRCQKVKRTGVNQLTFLGVDAGGTEVTVAFVLLPDRVLFGATFSSCTFLGVAVRFVALR